MAAKPSSTRVGARRFRAIIRKQGANPYVEVPETVTRAFTPFARAGRVSFEGTLNGTPIRGTLIPVGRGGQRLYVNGGMRSAAGVAVGDTASFVLRATHPEDVRTPSDVGAALRRVKGASVAFDKLPPTHRRQLLRHIDDARTPASRRLRIGKVIDHLVGEAVTTTRRDQKRPLWTCPRCGNQFVTRNIYHSCKRYRLEDSFRGKPPRIRELFDRFRAMVEACGPVRMVPYREKVGFMVRVRFAGAAPKREWLEVGFWLRHRVESERFHKIETLTPDAHVHLMRITNAKDLNREVAAWLEEAYAVGCQE